MTGKIAYKNIAEEHTSAGSVATKSFAAWR
jgi:hypothetical protein